MSTASDVIQSVGDLISDIDDLLASATVQAVVDLVDGVGGGAAIATLFESLAAFLADIRREIDRLTDAIAEPLRHARALGGLLGLLQPLVTGLQGVLALSADELADAGLDGAMIVPDALADAVGFSGEVLATGADILAALPSQADLDALGASLDGLIETVREYARETDRSAA